MYDGEKIKDASSTNYYGLAIKIPYNVHYLNVDINEITNVVVCDTYPSVDMIPYKTITKS